MRNIRKAITPEQEKYILENYPTKSLAKIGRYLKIDDIRIKDFLDKNNIPRIKRKSIAFLDESLEEIKTIYAQNNCSIAKLANQFNISTFGMTAFLKKHKIKLKSISEVTKTKLTSKQESEIMTLYKTGQYGIHFLCRKFKINTERFYSILNNYDIKPRLRGGQPIKLSERDTKTLINNYFLTNCIKAASESVGISQDVGRKILKSLKIHRGKVTKNFLEIFKLKYGTKQGRKKYNEYINNIKERTSGEKNHFFGKTPKETGWGWGCWYKNTFFRSLKELYFIVNEIEGKNLKWVSTENNGLRIKYIFQNKKRSYCPDFLIENKYLIEVKPKYQWKFEIVKAKCRAAKQFCKDNHLEYKIVDVKINYNVIKILYQQGLVIPTKRREEQFKNKFGI